MQRKATSSFFRSTIKISLKKHEIYKVCNIYNLEMNGKAKFDICIYNIVGIMHIYTRVELLPWEYTAEKILENLTFFLLLPETWSLLNNYTLSWKFISKSNPKLIRINSIGCCKEKHNTYENIIWYIKVIKIPSRIMIFDDHLKWLTMKTKNKRHSGYIWLNLLD